MLSRSIVLLFISSLACAVPTGKFEHRVVSQLDQAAFEEAHQRDDTATRAVTSSAIKTSDGRCLFVDELSGDFRANLNPIQVAACDGTTGQQWDVITAGKHNNVPGQALIVSALTQACFNFDPRRAAGNQVILFSCGGRAAGEGLVTDSQLFPFTSSNGPVTFSPANSKGATCFEVKGDVVDAAPCQQGAATQTFTFGASESTTGNGETMVPEPQPSGTAGGAQGGNGTVSTCQKVPSVRK